MRRWWFFAPVAGLVVFAGYLGLRAGALPTESEIINRYVAAYLQSAPAGAAATDCAATVHPDPAIRMQIICAHPSGMATTYFVGPRGRTLPAPQGPAI